MAAIASNVSVRQALLELEGEEFVRQAYLYALDRPADHSGLETYMSHLATGVARDVIVAELEASSEGQRVALRRGRVRPVGLATISGGTALPGEANLSNSVSAPQAASVSELLLIPSDATFLRAAYLTLLRREADPSGLENYLRQLASGCSREQVVFELATSPEGHQADSSLPGLADLVRGQLSAATVPEVNHVHDLLPLRPEVFVRTAYQIVLGREVDPQGFALYTDLLMQGWSRSYVLCELVNSDEGRALKPSLRGLKPLLKRYRKAQSRSLRGWYHRAVKGAESDLPQDRLLRAALLAGR